LEKITNIKSTK